jgi:hypothetical protein
VALGFKKGEERERKNWMKMKENFQHLVDIIKPFYILWHSGKDVS